MRVSAGPMAAMAPRTRNTMRVTIPAFDAGDGGGGGGGDGGRGGA